MQYRLQKRNENSSTTSKRSIGNYRRHKKVDVEWLAKKVIAMRIFNDSEGVMNLPISAVDGDILVVSQFTLHASTRKGNRPSYIRAARPETAIPLYRAFIDALNAQLPRPCGEGTFGADMQVALVNDGPVTIIIDSKLRE